MFLTYRADAEVDAFERVIATEPDIDFTAEDGVQHTAWNVFDVDIVFLQAKFEAMIFCTLPMDITEARRPLVRTPPDLARGKADLTVTFLITK